MSDNLVEDALGRALAYLRLAGLDADPALTRRALRLVDEMLEQGEDGLVERVMTALPERFPVPSRLHKGWKGALYNRLFVGTFTAIPRRIVRRFGWHLMAFCRR